MWGLDELPLILFLGYEVYIAIIEHKWFFLWVLHCTIKLMITKYPYADIHKTYLNIKAKLIWIIGVHFNCD